ncbi:MAG: molybdopterin-dependent oxidoreductase [Acidimicrobiia bacterium]
MTLRVYGRVVSPQVLTDEDLAQMPSPEEAVDGVVGSAVAARHVLARAEPDSEATHCTVIATGGSYRASIPLADLEAGGWLSYAVDGGPLPAAVGGPYRLIVAGGATLCWNVKEVAELKLTAGREPDDVPAEPTH